MQDGYLCVHMYITITVLESFMCDDMSLCPWYGSLAILLHPKLLVVEGVKDFV